jgi:hypothetical protein
MAPTGRADQNLGRTAFNAGQEIHKLAWSVPADPWAKLVTSNHDWLAGRNGEVSQELKHVPFSSLLGDGTQVTRFRTVIRAFEIRVAHVDIP